MGDMVIVAYRPKDDRSDELLELVKQHVPCLRRLGLVTDRPALAMRGADGAIVEVFEWHPGAAKSAHENAEVQELWNRFEAVCDYIALDQLPESRDMFAHFEPVDL